MTGEEMERAIAFILEQQAQFAANQQQHEEALLKHEEVMRRIEAVQEQTAQQVQHLSGAMIELAEAHTRTEGTLAETNEKLNALINTVERHVGSGGHGRE
jgi:hypothetical protein